MNRAVIRYVLGECVCVLTAFAMALAAILWLPVTLVAGFLLGEILH